MTRLPYSIRWGALIVGLAALLLPLGAGAAQAPQEDPNAQAPQGNLTEISDEKLQSVAKAFIQVVSIHERYLPLIEAAPTVEEAQQLQQQAADEMVQVISNADGVTIEEYNAIMQAAQIDEELRARLLAHIENEASLVAPPANSA